MKNYKKKIIAVFLESVPTKLNLTMLQWVMCFLPYPHTDGSVARSAVENAEH